MKIFIFVWKVWHKIPIFSTFCRSVCTLFCSSLQLSLIRRSVSNSGSNRPILKKKLFERYFIRQFLNFCMSVCTLRQTTVYFLSVHTIYFNFRSDLTDRFENIFFFFKGMTSKTVSVIFCLKVMISETIFSTFYLSDCILRKSVNILVILELLVFCYFLQSKTSFTYVTKRFCANFSLYLCSCKTLILTCIL